MSEISTIAILYRRVILEALLDLVTRNKRTEARIAKIESYNLFLNSDYKQDLNCLCSFASLPVNAVINVAKTLLKLNKTHKIVILKMRIMKKKHSRPMIERKLFTTL